MLSVETAVIYLLEGQLLCCRIEVRLKNRERHYTYYRPQAMIDSCGCLLL